MSWEARGKTEVIKKSEKILKRPKSNFQRQKPQCLR